MCIYIYTSIKVDVDTVLFLHVCTCILHLLIYIIIHMIIDISHSALIISKSATCGKPSSFGRLQLQMLTQFIYRDVWERSKLLTLPSTMAAAYAMASSGTFSSFVAHTVLLNSSGTFSGSCWISLRTEAIRIRTWFCATRPR